MLKLQLICSSFYDKGEKKALHVWPNDNGVTIGVDDEHDDHLAHCIRLDHDKIKSLANTLQSNASRKEDTGKSSNLENEILQLKHRLQEIYALADEQSLEDVKALVVKRIFMIDTYGDSHDDSQDE